MDYHTILTYRREERPDSLEKVKRHLGRLIRRLRDWYKRQGQILKWVANIERGKRGAWHIHLVINRIPGLDVKLAALWEYGRPKNVLIEDARGLDRLAVYITKGSVEGDSEEAETEEIHAFTHSRNLKFPKPVKKVYRRWKTWNREKIRIPKGYFLDPESVEEWTDCLGYMHREYTLYRLQVRRE